MIRPDTVLHAERYKRLEEKLVHTQRELQTTRRQLAGADKELAQLRQELACAWEQVAERLQNVWETKRLDAVILLQRVVRTWLEVRQPFLQRAGVCKAGRPLMQRALRALPSNIRTSPVVHAGNGAEKGVRVGKEAQERGAQAMQAIVRGNAARGIVNRKRLVHFLGAQGFFSP
eukprot:CAMPEP_0183354400 /NCGR_PEP_ID=MMETSP0164_2-20130417/37289_1 /TAXON_ID=221442 /ORGANISM="Coccolithus pelagicus ssp braarudi, Strain PLY182g" /LENGTH=173 /DNA_ID=CAMNT_0025527275 /DNA_START=20 /DNA_END=541 /DNA_ORIENTATION=+